jgi:uncharacterized protein
MKISVKDLSEGIHEFSDQLSHDDLKLIEAEKYPDPLYIDIFIDRIEQVFRFKIKVKTKACYKCDRCLDDFYFNFEEETEQIYQLGHSDLDEDDEIIVLPDNTLEIDITSAIQDIFLMSRPLKQLCKDDCKGLCVSCGANLNHEQCNCKKINTDPRLEKLKVFLK